MDEEEIKPGYTRISRILGQFTSFDHINPDVLENKKNIGTNLHKGIQAELEDGFPFSIGQAEKGYFESWMKWKDAVHAEFERWEERLYDDALKLTGKFDALVRLPNQTLPTLIDYKTSASPSHKTWEMQAHFYHYLLMQNRFTMLSDRFLWIQLNKHGFFPNVHIYTWNEDMMNKCFQAVYSYYRLHPVDKNPDGKL